MAMTGIFKPVLGDCTDASCIYRSFSKYVAPESMSENELRSNFHKYLGGPPIGIYGQMHWGYVPPRF